VLCTDEDMSLALIAMNANDIISLDTETTGLDVRNKRDHLMGLSFAVGDGDFSGYIPLRHGQDNVSMRWLEPLVSILQKKDLIWHNRKFDMHSLATLGVDPLSFKGKQYCTMMIAHLVNEEWPSKELDWLSKILLKKEKVNRDAIKNYAKVFGWATLTPAGIAAYGTGDAELPLELFKVLWPRIQEQELEDVYSIEERFTNLLYKMECRGVYVDQDFCARKAERGHTVMDGITKELGFNIGSHLQLGEYLLTQLGLPVIAHTDKCEPCKRGEPLESHEGSPSFNKRAMEDYDDILQASKDESARKVARYRGWQKAVTSLYEPMIVKVGPDGRVRTDFREAKTVTGRLSSSDPNLQQIPRGSEKEWNGDAKSAFREDDPEFGLFGWDYNQLEFRLQAAYGQEQWLLEEFKKPDADPFSRMAPYIYGTLTPETRYGAKTFTYANAYGARLRKIAATLGMSLDDARPLYDNFHATIPGIINISERIAYSVKERGYVKYWDGRRRHIRDRRESYKAFNSVCQGGAAQLVKRAMLRLEENECDDFAMVLQVHDEITCRVRRTALEDYNHIVTQAMTDWEDFGVTFAVEVKEWK
jgi:DNA polymerase-1